MALETSTTCRSAALVDRETGFVRKLGFEAREQMVHSVHAREF